MQEPAATKGRAHSPATSTGRAHPPARRQAAEEQVAKTMQHMKETEERLGGKIYMSAAFEESELRADSTMSVEVSSEEVGVGTSFSPQVTQISAFGHF